LHGVVFDILAGSTQRAPQRDKPLVAGRKGKTPAMPRVDLHPSVWTSCDLNGHMITGLPQNSQILNTKQSLPRKEAVSLAEHIFAKPSTTHAPGRNHPADAEDSRD
jgi:hypothetical protein